MEAYKRLAEPSSSMRVIQRHLDEQERLAKLLEPSPAIKQIQEAHKRAEQMSELLGHNQDWSRNIDRMPDLSRWAFGDTHGQRIFAEANRYLEAARMQEKADGFVRRNQLQLASTSALEFRLPTSLATQDILQSALYGSVTAWVKEQQSHRADIVAVFEQERLRAERMAQQFSAMHTPWLKLSHESSSLQAMVELSSIGSALKHVHPFDPGFTEALRRDFGDWRDAPAPDSSVWLRPDTRSDYYAQRGFNRQLTNFPDRAFAQGLFAAELCDDYLADLDVEGQIPTSDAKTEASIRRAGECHKAITLLEIELRNFIDKLMTEKYGADWVKSKVNDEVQKAWAAKQAKAAANGRPFARPIEASDFTEYENIICRRDAFDDVFMPFFRSRESVKESFKRLGPRRLDAMHARLVSNDDVLLVVAEVRRLVVAMRSVPNA